MKDSLILKKFNLPKNWEIELLDNLTFKIVDGAHHTPKYTESGVPFLRVTDIQSKDIDLSKVKFVSNEEHIQLISRCNPEKGDLLLSKNGSIGISKIVDWDWEFSIFVSLALIKVKKELDVEFLAHFFKSDLILWQLSRRAKQGTVTNLHLEEIREIEIPKLPLPQQRKIAQILSTVDAVLEKTEAAIAKYQQLKQGVMHDVFTRGIDVHTGQLRPKQTEAPELYKQSPLGWIPKEWEVMRMGDILKITTGGRDTQDRVENGKYPFYVRSQNIERINTYSFDGVGILTAGDGVGTGKVFHFVNGKIDFHQRVYLLYDFEENIIPEYVFEYFKLNFIHRVEKFSAKNTVDSVRLEMISDMLIPISIEQNKISKILNNLNQKIHTEQQALAKYQQLKAGLLQDLLTGKVEVRVN